MTPPPVHSPDSNAGLDSGSNWAEVRFVSGVKTVKAGCHQTRSTWTEEEIRFSGEIWSNNIIKSQLGKNGSSFQCHPNKLFIYSTDKDKRQRAIETNQICFFVYTYTKNLDLDFQVLKCLKPSFALTFTKEKPHGRYFKLIWDYLKCGSYKITFLKPAKGKAFLCSASFMN